MTPQEILNDIATRHALLTTQITGPRRSQRITWVRHLCAYAMYHNTACSHVEVGHILGGRDHTTNLNACQRALERHQDGSFPIPDEYLAPEHRNHDTKSANPAARKSGGSAPTCTDNPRRLAAMSWAAGQRKGRLRTSQAQEDSVPLRPPSRKQNGGHD